MLKRVSVAWCLMFGILCFVESLANAQAVDPGGQGDLRQLYRELKEQKRDKDIEVYYKQETIIREPEDRDAYLKHLLSELNKTLKKGKKEGTVRRVEGNLVEIDKGAVHKIRERDVYVVYDSSGRYKSKIEVEAIADTVSIAASYGQKNEIKPGDAIRFRGQRKLLGLGTIYGFSEAKKGSNYSGLGMIWNYTLRSGWGVDFLGTSFSRVYGRKSGVEYYREEVNVPLSLGVKKHFFYPFWISPFVGLGGSYLKMEHEYNLWASSSGGMLESSKGSTIRLVPYFAAGTQLAGKQFNVNLEARYFHGPKLNIDPEPVKIRPVIYCTSISFAW